MLLLTLCHFAALVHAYTHSFPPRDESATEEWPTLEFNVSLPLASLSRIGWAATYGAANQSAMNNTAGNGTGANSTADGAMSLLAANQTSTLNMSAIVGLVYVFGELGNTSTASRSSLRFTRNGTDVHNRASSSSGVIGQADSHWDEVPLTIHAGLSTVIRKIEVTARMATAA